MKPIDPSKNDLPMDARTVAVLRDQLIERRRRILTQLLKSQEEEIPWNELNGSEMGDVAQSLELLGRVSSLQEQERRELQSIERSLAKISTGSFGECESCGDSIGVKRLEVLPEAKLCTQCQSIEERENARHQRSHRTAVA